MKKKHLLLAIAVGATLPMSAELLPVTWRINPSFPLPAPLVVDSVNVTGDRYSEAVLLELPLSVKADHKSTVSKADTVLTLSKADHTPTVQTIVTRVRPDGYAKGSLKVKCPTRFQLFIDGKKQGSSSTVSASGAASASLAMEPYSDHEIAVRILSMPTDSLTPAVRMEWTPDADYKDVMMLADASAKRRFSLDDSTLGERVNRQAVSPDGNWLLTNFSNMYEPDKILRRSTLTDLRTGRTVELPSTPVLNWTTAGATLYGANKGEEGYDIVTLNPATMEQKVIARHIPETNLAFNAKGDKFYYTVVNKHKEQSGPLKRQLSPGSRAIGETDGAQLFECDTKSGVVRPLTFGGAVRIADVHPFEEKLLIILARETPTQRPFFTQEALQLNTLTGQVDTIVPEDKFLSAVSYSPDGKKILVLGSAAIYDGIGARIGNEPIVNDFDMQAYLLNPADGSVKPLSADFNPNIKQATWCIDGKIYLLAEEGFNNNIYTLDPSTLKYTKVPMSVANIRGISVSNDGGKIAYWGQDETHAGAGYIYDTRKKKDSLIANPLAERLSQIQMSDSEVWQYTDPEGTVIDGYITYPPEFDASKKWPLIVYYYGGTSPSQKGISNPYTPQLFASRGYVVYILNPSGTTGYGQEFSARHVNAWGKRTANDIINATKELCKTHPFIDETKIGCLGASYGGFMTQYLQTQTPMFAAAVSHAGISNVTSYWGEGWWGHSYNAIAAADSYPWNNPQLFTEQGSLFNADKIHTPLLLLHGMSDTNVPPGESIQIFNALRILDRPVEFIGVDGEDHFISNYGKRKQWHASIMAWFDLWLKDNPNWWSALYPDSPYAKDNNK